MIMSKFVKAETDGSLKINVKTKLFEKIRESRTWFINRYVCGLMMLGLAISDTVGFWQIANETISESTPVRILIIVAFTASFELAPLYMGYSISLKCYDLGKKIHNIILSFSIISFLLGIILNGVYRYMTMNIVYLDISSTNGTEQTSEVALPVTILLTFLPLITSLINIVIGCLAFDPLYFDMIRIKKRLSILQEKKRQLEVRIAEMDNDNELENSAMNDAETEFDSATNGLKFLKDRLITYAQIISSTSVQ